MSGGVTYNGVESATGGNIFGGTVFWVAQRVPTRNDILNLIKSNGGEVVPLEKDAHILIADHARKDAHPDSYSWKYITDSVKYGVSQMTDRYRIFGHPETGRASVGSSAPRKLTRTPFSRADDAALANWVLTHRASPTGNKLFQEFAETHTWHTWQSWRSRFKSALSHLSNEDLKKLAMSAADLAVENMSSSSRAASKQATPKQGEKQPLKAAQTPKASPAKQPARTPLRAAVASPSTHPDETQIQVVVEDTHRSRRRSDREPSGESSPPRELEESQGGTEDAMRHRFYTDLVAFAEETEASIEPEPCIDGKVIDLWDLSRSVASQNVPVEEVDWRNVAEYLEFNWADTPEVIGELEDCYQRNLADFFEAMSAFSRNDDGEVDIQQVSETSSSHYDLPSSPPGQRSNRKRPLSDDTLPIMGTSSKRRRLDRNAIIPSTPEQKTAVLATQSPSVVKANTGRDAHAGSSRRLPARNPPHLTGGDNDGGGNLETVSVQIPRLATEQSSFEVTPSQQLHSEAFDASPIPLNLQARRDDPVEQAARTSKSFKEPIARDETRRHTGTRTTKRSLPASFAPAPGRFSPQQAEERARRPSAPARIDLDEEGHSQEIRDCAEYYESLGYSRPIVVESLMRTTMTPGWPTSLLLERLQKKEGVPSNCEGIWTDRDDRSLRYADAVKVRESSASTKELNKAKKELERIVHKHTQEAVDLRRRFLLAQANMGKK